MNYLKLWSSALFSDNSRLIQEIMLCHTIKLKYGPKVETETFEMRDSTVYPSTSKRKGPFHLGLTVINMKAPLFPKILRNSSSCGPLEPLCAK